MSTFILLVSTLLSRVPWSNMPRSKSSFEKVSFDGHCSISGDPVHATFSSYIIDHGWSWCLHGSCISLDISSDQNLSNNTLLCASHFMTSCCFWKCNRNSAYWLYNSLPRFLVDECRLICTHCRKLMKLEGSHGSSAMLSMMKVMVWHFFSDSHTVMTSPIVVLPSNCCC
jgi:hypothetical protein